MANAHSSSATKERLTLTISNAIGLTHLRLYACTTPFMLLSLLTLCRHFLFHSCFIVLSIPILRVCNYAIAANTPITQEISRLPQKSDPRYVLSTKDRLGGALLTIVFIRGLSTGRTIINNNSFTMEELLTVSMRDEDQRSDRPFLLYHLTMQSLSCC